MNPMQSNMGGGGSPFKPPHMTDREYLRMRLQQRLSAAGLEWAGSNGPAPMLEVYVPVVEVKKTRGRPKGKTDASKRMKLMHAKEEEKEEEDDDDDEDSMLDKAVLSAITHQRTKKEKTVKGEPNADDEEEDILDGRLVETYYCGNSAAVGNQKEEVQQEEQIVVEGGGAGNAQSAASVLLLSPVGLDTNGDGMLLLDDFEVDLAWL